MSEISEPDSDRWESLVERRIREAREQGFFDNLPGRGRPLELEENPFEDPGWRLVHHMLKAHGLAPRWIELDRWIRAELIDLRCRLEDATAWAVDLARLVDEGRVAPEQAWRLWHRERTRLERGFAVRARRLNRAIDRFNLIVPLVSLQRAKIDIAAQLRQIQEEVERKWAR